MGSESKLLIVEYYFVPLKLVWYDRGRPVLKNRLGSVVTVK